MSVLEEKVKELQKENEQLKRQIKIKDAYCELIYAIGFDYDGYNEAKDLKELIDELVKYSSQALQSNDKVVMYNSPQGNKNILGEALNK